MIHAHHRKEIKSFLKKGIKTNNKLYDIALKWKSRVKELALNYIKLQKEFEQSKERHNEEILSIKAEHEENIKALSQDYENKMKELTKKIEEQQKELEYERYKSNNLQKDLDDKFFMIQKAKGEIVVRNFLLTKEKNLNVDLEAKNDALSEEIKQNTKQISELENKIVDLTNENNEMKMNYENELNDKNNMIESLKYDIEKEISKSKSQSKSYKKELREKERTIESLNKDINNLVLEHKNELDTITKEMNDKDQVIKSLTLELEQKDSEIRSLKEQICQLNEELEIEKGNRCDEDLIQLKNEAVAIFKRIQKELEERKQELDQENAILKATITNYEDKIFSLEETISTLKDNEKKLVQSLELAKLGHYQLLLQIDTVITISNLNYIKAQNGEEEIPLPLPSDFMQFERQAFSLLAELEHSYESNQQIKEELNNLNNQIIEKDDKMREESRIFSLSLKKLEDMLRSSEEKCAQLSLILAHIKEELIKNANDNPIAKELLLQWKSMMSMQTTSSVRNES